MKALVIFLIFIKSFIFGNNAVTIHEIFDFIRENNKEFRYSNFWEDFIFITNEKSIKKKVAPIIGTQVRNNGKRVKAKNISMFVDNSRLGLCVLKDGTVLKNDYDYVGSSYMDFGFNSTTFIDSIKKVYTDYLTWAGYDKSEEKPKYYNYDDAKRVLESVVGTYFFEKYLYTFNTLPEMLSFSKFNNPGKRFKNDLSEAKKNYSNLLLEYENFIVEKNESFFKPYQKEVWVYLETDIDWTSYKLYKSANINSVLAYQFSKYDVGYADYVTSLRCYYPQKNSKNTYNRKISPTWKEVKDFYGSLRVLNEKRINKDTPIFLTYNIDKIEFNYDDDLNKISSFMFISLNSSEHGKEFYKNILKKGSKIIIDGEAKVIYNPFKNDNKMKFINEENREYKEDIVFECRFTDNPINENIFYVPLNAISDNSDYNFKQLSQLYYDEIETICNGIIGTNFDSKSKRIGVNLLNKN